eukprot:615380-Prymnesium_polylepis.1
MDARLNALRSALDPCGGPPELGVLPHILGGPRSWDDASITTALPLGERRGPHCRERRTKHHVPTSAPPRRTKPHENPRAPTRPNAPHCAAPRHTHRAASRTHLSALTARPSPLGAAQCATRGCRSSSWRRSRRSVLLWRCSAATRRGCA